MRGGERKGEQNKGGSVSSKKEKISQAKKKRKRGGDKQTPEIK